MKQIKFRAWDGTKMVSPDYITRENIAYWHEDSILCSSKIIMQYTGLKDENRVEIFEGDILKIAAKFIGIVKYKRSDLIIESKEGKLYYFSEFISDFIYQAIGNIYENKELLK